MASDNQKVIAMAGLVSVAVGSANSMVKYKRPPASRFLIGSGIAYLILSAMGETDALGELAKGLAVGIMSTIILGEGGGVMSYFVGREGDTTAPAKERRDAGEPRGPAPTIHVPNQNGNMLLDHVPAFPGVPPTRTSR